MDEHSYMQAVSSFEKHIFFICVNEKCFSRGQMSSFERNTILSHLPGTLKVFLMTYLSISFNNITLFTSRGAQLACFTENRDLPGF